MIGGLYTVENPFAKVLAGMGQAAGSLAAMTKERKTEYKPPPKSFGGATYQGVSGAIGGYSTGTAIGGSIAAAGVEAGATASTVASTTAMGAQTGGYWGAAIGAAIGIMSYLLS